MGMVEPEILSTMPRRISILNHGTISNHTALRMVTTVTITIMPSRHLAGNLLHLALAALPVVPLHLFRTLMDPMDEDSLKALRGTNNLLTTDPNLDMDHLPEDTMIVVVVVIPIEDIMEDVRRVLIIKSCTRWILFHDLSHHLTARLLAVVLYCGHAVEY